MTEDVGVPGTTEMNWSVRKPPAPSEDSDPSTLVSNAPPPNEITDKYDPTKAGPSPYDDPEFQKDLEEGIAAQIEGWQRDWSIRVNALMVALTLSRPEAMLYLLLMQIGTLRGIASGFQHMWNAEPALRRRAMQDALLEAQLKERGFELGEKEDPGVPISEAARLILAKGWKIR